MFRVFRWFFRILGWVCGVPCVGVQRALSTLNYTITETNQKNCAEKLVRPQKIEKQNQLKKLSKTRTKHTKKIISTSVNITKKKSIMNPYSLPL